MTIWGTMAEIFGGWAFDWLAFDKHKSPWLKAVQVVALIVFVSVVCLALYLVGDYFLGEPAE